MHPKAERLMRASEERATGRFEVIIIAACVTLGMLCRAATDLAVALTSPWRRGREARLAARLMPTADKPDLIDYWDARLRVEALTDAGRRDGQDPPTV